MVVSIININGERVTTGIGIFVINITRDITAAVIAHAHGC